MVRRRDEAQPARITGECRVPAAGPDRGDRTPEHVVVLGVPAGDQGVGARCGQHGEETGVVLDRDARGGRDSAPRAVPLEHGLVTPEPPDVGLLRRTGAVRHRSQRLHLVVVTNPVRGVERGRFLGAELVRALQGPRHDGAGPGRLRRQEPGRSPDPDPRFRGRLDDGRSRVAAVVDPEGQDAGGRLLSGVDAVVLGGAVGDCGQG